MDFWKTILVLLRRWYVAVPVLLLSLGSAAAIYASVPLRYESHGITVLTSSAVDPDDSAGVGQEIANPMLAFYPGLEVSAAIITQSLNTETYLTELVGSSGADLVELSSNGGFITVTTESTAEERPQLLVTAVLQRVDQELIARQNALGAPPSTFIAATSVVAPTEPKPLIGSKVRAAGVALILGLAASLGSAYMLESVLDGRRHRAEQQNPGRPTMVHPLRQQPSGQAQPAPNSSRRRPG